MQDSIKVRGHISSYFATTCIRPNPQLSSNSTNYISGSKFRHFDMSSYGTVDTDGCSIRYWYQGTSPLLIFVPGGNGHERQFNPIMGLLDTHFTVATFDRRQTSASTSIAGNRPLNPAQQARDSIAVMKAIGYTTTSLCTSSSGEINGLQ